MRIHSVMKDGYGKEIENISLTTIICSPLNSKDVIEQVQSEEPWSLAQ